MIGADPVLLVEDDAEVADVIGAFLTEEGYTVRTAATGRAALAALEESVGIVLLDLRLPDMDGTAVMQATRRLARPPDVVVITGYATVESAVAAVEAGAAGYVYKPLDLNHLRSLLRTLVDRRARAGRELRERDRAREIEAVLTVSRVLGNTLELEAVLDRAVREVPRSAGVDACSIFMWQDGRLDVRVSRAGDGQDADRLQPGFRLADAPAHAIAVERHEAVVIADASATDLLPGWWCTAFGIKSALVVPVVVGEQVIATLSLERTGAAGPFGEADLRLGTAIATQLALSIDNARLYQHAERERRRLGALYDIARSLASVDDPDEILSLIVHAAARLLGAEAAGLRLLEGDELVARAMTESAAPLMRRFRIKIGESLSGRVVAMSAPVLVEDLSTDDRYDPAHRRGAVEHGFRSFLGIPLRAGDRIIGALNLFTKERRRFTADEVSLATAFADQASVAIEKARLHDAVEAQRNQLAQIFDSTSDGILLVTPEGPIAAANQRAGELLGSAPELLVGQDLAAALGVDVGAVEHGETARALRAALTGPDRVEEGDLELTPSARVLHWTAGTTRDATGATVGLTLTLQDVTREREMSRLKSDFVSFATHQLRTPLAGIKWLLELAQQDDTLAEETRDLVADARASAERLTMLVNEMLDSSRLERGVVAVDLQPTDLAEITRGVMSELTTLIADKAQEVTFDADPGAPAVLVDPQLIRQVVLNLLSNAMKYTPARGKIALTLRGADGQALWSIRDTGIGIPASARERLFEKFYRADNAVTLETEGTGLGLHLVRLLVERFGGRVWCESVEGEGAEFSFTVPFAS
jgi:PAS domain S-box-containing protein